jgi:predicted flap endonuclease-1-like 5' DNA nuclease
VRTLERPSKRYLALLGIISISKEAKIMFRKFSLIGLLVVGLVQTACSGPAEEAGQSRGIPWWVWLGVIVVMVALFLWLCLSEPRKKAAPPTKPEAAAPTARPETAAPSHVVETPEGVARRVPLALSEVEVPMTDDLTRIEGIGPRISGLLRAAGITTFAHLASTDVRRLQRIIAEAGLTALADPATWPEQATLAATGQWDVLEALQGELKGGRRA